MSNSASTTEPAVVRILVAEDHPLVRLSLRRIIAAAEGFTIIGEAEDGVVALQLARELRPDVILMDITMPRLNGIEATRLLVHGGITAKVIAVSLHPEAEVMKHALLAGAHGYVIKNRAARELVAAVRAVLAGETFVSAVDAFAY